MNLNQIKRLVNGGESISVEFKRKAAHPEKIVRELVAFANTSGGYLLVGVDDSTEIIGLKNYEEEAYVLENAIAELCRPKIEYKDHVIHITPRKTILAFHISESKSKPHFAMSTPEAPRGIAYIRIQDMTVRASREKLEIMRRNRRPYDIQFNFGQKEKILMEYLDRHRFITVNQFKQMAEISKRAASDTLILLVLANVISIIPQAKQDVFTLASNPEV